MKIYIDKKWKKDINISLKEFKENFYFKNGESLFRFLFYPILRIILTIIYPLLFIYYWIIFGIITLFFIKVKK